MTAVLLIIWLSFYICREAFHSPLTGHLHSMHGEWYAIARTVGLDWFRPHWFRFQAAGAPIEYLYAPLVPFLLALGDPARMLNAVAGMVYILGPLLLYVALWRLLKTPWPGLVAAMCYVLLTPTELFLPDAGWRPNLFFSARRMYLLWDWDEVPHSLALCFAPVLGWLMLRGRFQFAVACSCVMMLASMFGVVHVALVTGAVLLATNFETWKKHVAVPLVSWLIVSPWFPPSLFRTIRTNSVANFEVPPEARPLLALLIVGCCVLALWFAIRRRMSAEVRWLLLYCCPLILIPVLFQHCGFWFLQQSGRYKVEAELAAVILFALLVYAVFRRAPVWLSIALMLPLFWMLSQQVVPHRRYAKGMLRSADVDNSIEARSARWIAANLPGERVLLSGSMAQWANAFADVDQLSGMSYPTVSNPRQQIAINEAHWGLEPQGTLEWLRRFGVSAIVVPGPQSPEFWRPYQKPDKFEGVLPVLWREQDTTVYAVPGSKLVEPEGTLEWKDSDHAVLTAKGSVRVAVNAMPGWTASRGTIRVNEHELMMVDTGCNEPCRVDLTYRGSAEAWITRFVSLLTLAMLVWKRR